MTRKLSIFLCLLLFQGLCSCEIPDPCAGIDCGDNGTCEEGICDCDPGYTGENCENTEDPCNGFFCGEHGACVGGTCVCESDYEGDACEIHTIMKDQFPGYEENADWYNGWVRGIGSLSYSADEPGFAHLLLEGPGAAGTYHNAEKKHYNSNAQFLYCDVEMRLRNSNNNGWDAPGAPGTPDPAYGLGSRGWGLWNDQIGLSGANVIWFTSISPDSDSAFQGTQVWVINNGVPVIMQDLNIDLTEWHTYHIQWRDDYLGIFIDNMTAPIAEIVNPASIPGKALVFTAWVDNYIFEGDFFNFIRGYLAVPDIGQSIDIDYVHIYQVD